MFYPATIFILITILGYLSLTWMFFTLLKEELNKGNKKYSQFKKFMIFLVALVWPVSSYILVVIYLVKAMFNVERTTDRPSFKG